MFRKLALLAAVIMLASAPVAFADDNQGNREGEGGDGRVVYTSSDRELPAHGFGWATLGIVMLGGAGVVMLCRAQAGR